MMMIDSLDMLLGKMMNDVAERPVVSTLVGTPKEIRVKLAQSDAEQVVVVALQHSQPNLVKSVAESLSSMASSMFDLLARQDRDSLERLAEMLVPPAPPSPRLLREAAMLGRARTMVLESGDWLTAAQVAQTAQLSTRNPSAQPNKWKKQGRIFAIRHGSVDYFPGYALDPDAGFRPVPELARIIDIFSDHKDGWGMAYWFSADNSFLNGRRPQDVLRLQPERVIQAAMDEVQEVSHG